MIRLIQRRLIIPRGDTGSFNIPVLQTPHTGEVATFLIYDSQIKKTVFWKNIQITEDVLTVSLSHDDTVNLIPKKYLWDIKLYYGNIEYAEDDEEIEFEKKRIINADEITSYYASFGLPICEIKPIANITSQDDTLINDLTSEQKKTIADALAQIKSAVKKTQENVTHYPIIKDGNWFIWDAQQSDYVDTGVTAEGKGTSTNIAFDNTPTSGSTNAVTSNGIYEAISNINNMNIHICSFEEYDEDTGFPLVQVPDSKTIYLVPNLNETENNVFVEWIYVNNEWEIFGTANINLSEYVKFSNFSSGFNVNSNNNISINVNRNYGIELSQNQLRVSPATSADIKNPNLFSQKPIIPLRQYESVFYGLATAAGVDEGNSEFPVGEYSEEAKSAISEMLNGIVYIASVTPVFNALPGLYYICDEVAALAVTAPSSGIVNIMFKSGEIPTVLTITSSTNQVIKWANNFDPTTLEANTTYEIKIINGQFASVLSWT